jgi:glycosyltransferase involved in cell wall biosynthesis
MRITLANTHDLIGGAERCSYDLARVLHEGGDHVELIVGRKLGDDPFIRQMAYHPADWKLRAFTRERFGLTDTTIAAPLYGCWTLPSLRRADVYNVHNMHGGYWNFWTLPVLSRRAPLVLTLHDEWLLTGDCAYSYDCERWRQSCGSCPQAALPDPVDRVCIGGRDATRLNLRLKRAMFRSLPRDRIEIVTPSRWLCDRVGESPHLSRFRRRVIPNGIDLEQFRPHDPGAARRALGLPAKSFLVLVSAANPFDRRKNLGLALDAARAPAWPADARLVVAGRTTDELERELLDDPRCIPVGYVSGREELARVISACDLTLIPSRAENLPYAGLEAQACGCPVLGAAVGGIPETFSEDETGWSFAPDLDGAALAERIRAIRELPPERQREVRAKARGRVSKRFGLDEFVGAYRGLFEELAAARRANA